MIAVDTSALVAILEEEDDAALYRQSIAESRRVLVSAATLVELAAVMWNKRRSDGPQRISAVIDDLLEGLSIEVHPFDEVQAHLARRAYQEHGILNFGDAFSYALAKAMGAPLLFKGDDFSRTDLWSALPAGDG